MTLWMHDDGVHNVDACWLMVSFLIGWRRWARRTQLPSPAPGYAHAAPTPSDGRACLIRHLREGSPAAVAATAIDLGTVQELVRPWMRHWEQAHIGPVRPIISRVSAHPGRTRQPGPSFLGGRPSTSPGRCVPRPDPGGPCRSLAPRQRGSLWGVTHLGSCVALLMSLILPAAAGQWLRDLTVE